MIAVWIFFTLGVIATIVCAIPAVIEAYVYISAYIVTTKELTTKKKQLRQEKIANLKLKDIEVKDNDKIELKDDETPKSTIDTANYAKDIVSHNVSNDQIIK